MHWTDAATRDWLLHFGLHLGSASLLVLLAYRAKENNLLQAVAVRVQQFGPSLRVTRPVR